MTQPPFSDEQIAYIKESLMYLCDTFEKKGLHDATTITKKVFRGLL